MRPTPPAAEPIYVARDDEVPEDCGGHYADKNESTPIMMSLKNCAKREVDNKRIHKIPRG
jgi:hypothetical protein